MSDSEPRTRCAWCVGDARYEAYHDDEWGVPEFDDRELFARLMLEGFQAGLSWRTILHKRDNFDRAFDGWDPERISRYGADDIARLMADAGIVRNRLKVAGAVANARAFLALGVETGSASRHLWSFVGGGPLLRPAPRSMADIPSSTPESDAMAKDLKRRGFTFVGTTICYAFMQSVGMVDDHVVGCWRATS